MSLGNVKRGDTPNKFNVIIEIPANAVHYNILQTMDTFQKRCVATAILLMYL